MIEQYESILVFAAKHYLVKGARTEEFMNDLNTVSTVARCINRRTKGNPSSVRLMLNQIVMLSNSFGVQPTTEMLLSKVKGDGLGILYPMLVFLGYMTEEQLSREHVTFDQDVIRQLREMV